LQTHHSRERQQAPSYFASRVIVETLKQARGLQPIDIGLIADRANTTTKQVALVLNPLLQHQVPSDLCLATSARFKLAYEAVKHGALLQVARALTWQEFEAFTEECLQIVGFDTQKGIIVKQDSTRWQIDVIGKKSRIILAIDCKHWESPAYQSKLRNAAEHQKLALQALTLQMVARGEVEKRDLLALPVILTLFEPRSRLVDSVVVISIDQFADFLDGITPYSSELPFIPVQELAKNSIR
jgi:hypothetical protein